MTSERDLMREGVTEEWRKLFNRVVNHAQETGIISAGQALGLAMGLRAQHSTAEPFGYFRADPFGWTDCAETDEGAKALYEAAPQQAPLPESLHTFLDAAAGEGFVLGGVDAADLYVALFPERYATATLAPGAGGGGNG